MKPIHVGIIISVQLLSSISISLKTVSIYVLMIILGWTVKCALQGPPAPNSNPYINLRPISRESDQTQCNIVTSQIQFAKKKSFYLRANKISVVLISTVRSGGQSLIGYVVDKIPHLFHPLLKTKCPVLVPKIWRAFLTNILLHTKVPAADAIPPIIQPYHTQQFLSSMLQKSKCLN